MRKQKIEQEDPSLKGQHAAGVKLDCGKIYADLVLGDFAPALKRICEVGTFGAHKYTRSGWKEVPHGIERYKDAAMRHWLAHSAGEVIDEESGCNHLWCVAWNYLAVITLMEAAE